MKSKICILTSVLIFIITIFAPISAEAQGAPTLKESFRCREITILLKLKSIDQNTKKQVSCLQDFLNKKDIYTGSPSGYFGTQTQKALREYQKTKGLKPTGTTGILTRVAINKDMQEASLVKESKKEVVSMRPQVALAKLQNGLQYGSTGIDVIRLHIFLDSLFGTNLSQSQYDVFDLVTVDSVKRFQSLKALTPEDGRVVGNTLDLINYEIGVKTGKNSPTGSSGQASKAISDKVVIHEISSVKISKVSTSNLEFSLIAEYSIDLENMGDSSVQVNLDNQRIPLSQALFTEVQSKTTYMPNRSQFNSRVTLGADGIYVLKPKTRDTLTVQYKILSYYPDSIPASAYDVPRSDIERLPLGTYVFEVAAIIVNNRNILKTPLSSPAYTLSR